MRIQGGDDSRRGGKLGEKVKKKRREAKAK